MKRVHLLALLCMVGAAVPVAYADFGKGLAFRDFSDFWLAGRAVVAGVDPYNVQGFGAFGRQLIGNYAFNWTYPPPMLFVAVPASLLPLSAAFVLWTVVTAAFFYWAAGPFLPRDLRFLALVTPAAIVNVAFGQTGFLIGALWFLAFRFPPASALLIVKPQIGFLTGLSILSDWRRTVLGAAMAGALIVASALVFGGWGKFVAHVTQVQAHDLWSNREIVWILLATTPAVAYGMAGWIVFSAAASWILARNFNVWTAATATFLISPYGFHYDMTVVCAGLLLLLYENGERMPPWKAAAVVAAFLSPAWVRLAGTWFVPPVLLLALLVQVEWQPKPRPSIKRGDPACAQAAAAADR